MGKHWPLLIIMRHFNRLSCKYVSTLINLHMNRDLYYPIVVCMLVQRILHPHENEIQKETLSHSKKKIGLRLIASEYQILQPGLIFHIVPYRHSLF